MTLFPTITLGASTTSTLPISTPLGDVTFGVACDGVPLDLADGSAYDLPHGGQFLHWATAYGPLEALRCRPALLPEYAHTISDCWAILWRIHLAAPLARLQFSSLWHPTISTYSGGPTPGQAQETQTWDDFRWTLSLGTEGEDVLYHRAVHHDGLPPQFLSYATPKWEVLPFVAYDAHGLRLNLPAIEAGEMVQAQFCVAWAEYDANSTATWEAVCLSDRHILAGVQG